MYALFCGKIYYPNGGMGDFKGIFRSKEEAAEAYHAGDQWADDYVSPWEWGHIVDITTMETVQRFIFEKEA